MIDSIGTVDPREPGVTSSTILGVSLTTLVAPALQSERGGDWCDVFAVSDDLIALSIGDVSGHGAGAFATKMAISEVIQRAAKSKLAPADVISIANRFMCELDPVPYATAIFGLLNPKTRLLTFANAGHPPPFMAAIGGSKYLEFQHSDLLLGVESDFRPQPRTVHVPAGALIVFYTDGVIERDRKPLNGVARLRDAVIFAYQRAQCLTASVIEEQMARTGSDHDDAAILTAWLPMVTNVPSVRGDVSEPTRVAHDRSSACANNGSDRS